ncbi:MAG: 2-oxoglutarate oxidoreductase [Calditrichaeota bacterium]|nr:MAG: 2-oxoglutarate oxidoreductase [Calditrichota bacterium]MBL1207686.1 2-oxoglutarate oxidoreductase [Calditrichota bacterium]NOG47520.1 2-oxoglutarate oxidoreductase [Calditrichota bacterium]
MFGVSINNIIDIDQKHYSLEDYQGDTPRWCPGCGDNGILTAAQRICREEQLPPEKTVFVSGIGCSSRFPHYMNTYGFHGLHGRALPIAQGIKIRRPDLHVFVNMGDGDCTSIGTAHWIHAIRYNFNMTVMLHDNGIYGLTKKQASPTSPLGTKSNTTPEGTVLNPLNPTVTTLGVENVSFVAQAVEWIPELLYDIIRQAYHHKGFAFVRIMQRCPHYTPAMFDPLMSTPENLMLLTHENGMQISDPLKKVYKNIVTHDPSEKLQANYYAEKTDTLPIGILYKNENLPTYDELRAPERTVTTQMKQEALDVEFDKFGINPRD